MKTFSGNTIPYKTVWIEAYQATHYRQAAFPMFADLRFENELVHGASIKWSYDGETDVTDMDASGAYTVENKTVTDETLTVDKLPTSANRIPLREKIQDHRPTQEKWATKQMNMIFTKIDGDVLGALQAAAASSLSAGDFGGTAGDPITLSSANAAAIFTAARRKLRNANIIYDTTRKFANVMKLDNQALMPVAAIPAELEEQLLLQIGFKNTELGDTTLKQGYLGLIFGFNAVQSNNLPYTAKITFSATPTDASTLTIGGVALTWETGTIDVAGEIKAETSATVSVTNLVNFLNSPYATIVGESFALTRTSLTIPQRRIWDNISAVDGGDGSCVITIKGQNVVAFTQTDANGTISKQAVHALFGTNKSIAMIMQRQPNLTVSAGDTIGNGSTGGYIAKDFVTWAIYGRKVFLSQTYQMVDVPIDCSAFTTSNNSFL